MDGTALQQRVVVFSGNVQGVGFRYAARQLASCREVTGCVRNLPDGRVELAVEGRSGEIQAFLEDLLARMGDHIHSEQSDTRPATGQRHSFEIQR